MASMAETQVLPLDVLDLIFQNLVRRPRTLMKCALVCKQWLSPSRRHLQSLKDITLVETFTGTARDWKLEWLLNCEPECSFWPHINKLTIESWVRRESCETYVRLLLKSLSLASNLRALELERFKFPALPKDAFPRNNTISSLRLNTVQFTSPAQLLDLLTSLQNLHAELKLEDIRFCNVDWDFDKPDFVHHPSLRVHLEPDEKDTLPLILRYNWNVTSLTMETLKSVGVDLYNQLLQRVGPSLETIYLPIQDLLELGHEDQDGDEDEDEDEEHRKISRRRNERGLISLEYNTALREILVGKVEMTPESSDGSYAYTQLASILATITSGEKFERLRCDVTFFCDYEEEDALIEYDDNDDNEEKYRFVESFNWKALDDVLGNKERFPGKGPSFEIGLVDALLNDTVAGVLLPRCMPKLAQRGNIVVHDF